MNREEGSRTWEEPRDPARKTLDESTGIMLLIAGVFLLAAWRIESTGASHSLMLRLQGSIGSGLWYLVLVLVLWGVKKFRGLPVISSWFQLIGWVALLPVFLGFLQIFDPADQALGGRLGFSLHTNLQAAVGRVSAAILLTGLFLSLSVICLDTPLSQIAHTVYAMVSRVLIMLKIGITYPLRALYLVVYFTLILLHAVIHIILNDAVVISVAFLRYLRTESIEGEAREVVPRTVAPSEAPPLTAEGGGNESGRLVVEGAVRVPPPDDVSEILGGPVLGEGEEAHTEAAPVEDRPAAGEGSPSPAASGEPLEYVPPSEPLPEEPDVEPGTALDLAGEDDEAPRAVEEDASGGLAGEPPPPPPEPYVPPGPEIFDDPTPMAGGEAEEALRLKAEQLVHALAQFKIECMVNRVVQGPTVTQFEVRPAPGVKISTIVNLSNDIAMALATPAVRIEAPIPGKAAVGIEVPNRKPVPVTFKEIITSEAFGGADSSLAFALGKEITGKPVVGDLTKMPHLLVAGATGSGKSVCIHTLLASLLYRNTPDSLKLILIDPKRVELTLYSGIPNLVTEVITDPQDAPSALKWAVLEMERRYRYLSRFTVRDIRSFNAKLQRGELESLDPSTPLPDVPMPYVVVVIDELADLMMLARREIEEAITRLAQMARAIGIHLVLATQRPSTNVITGVLKANLPSRIALSVSSQVDSKVILDGVGAEKLLGRGDMLYSPIGQAKPVRVQGAYISEDELARLVDNLKRAGEPDYTNIIEEVMQPQGDLVEEGLSDDKFSDCVRIALEKGEASTSMLQRHLKIGYNRAARIIEAMQERGIISGPESGKRRKLLVTPEEAETFIEDAP